jgi:Concanavalin A-like lectin/glucanases superfamily
VSSWKQVPRGDGPPPGSLIAEILADEPVTYHRKLATVGGGSIPFDAPDSNAACPHRGIDYSGNDMDLIQYWGPSQPEMTDAICDPGDDVGAMLFDLGNNLWNPGDNNVFEITGVFSLSLWLRNDLAANANWHDVVRKGDSYGIVMQASTGKLQGFIDTVVITDPGSVVVGTVYHVGLIYDGTTLRLYKNGIEVASALSGNPALETESYSIGSNGLAQNGWQGALAEVALFDYALDPERMLVHYEAGVLA